VLAGDVVRELSTAVAEVEMERGKLLKPSCAFIPTLQIHLLEGRVSATKAPP